ncbi:DUF1002 domain-containing protein [Blautia glucerasea]|uniref:DUF1002 domain-containing protein n=1 Tax=Blautia glucerasea TaxID=536633 RepID=UPI001D01F45E|nr:DUF1002 domain-containing protein [Blautia glucerasea]MCB5385583.1 DUF1002 domain-containing protein [Blautia glucerasea]MCB5420262.1 DUF1002 domain-containing protein [Blautia luti]
MKKGKLFATLLCSASMVMGSMVPTIPVMADAMKVVTLGADLSEDQKNTMLRYFKVDSSQAQIIYVTNQDERDHLSAYVPLEQIGTRTVSCAYVKPTTSGGIKVRTANLNWVTCNMIASSLSTSGVTNCEVVAACPFEVSGTGALTGIQMAYETASGEKLDETKKELATEEMVVTGNLADSVGQNDATTVINQAKMQVIADNIQNADDIYNIVVNISNNNNVSLSDDEINTIVNLLKQIAEQNYDYSEMQETLERVNDNVTGQADESDDSSDEEDTDSIVDNVDQGALGDNVIESSTEDPGLAEETGADSSDDEQWEEFPTEDGTEDTEDASTDDTAEDGSEENTDGDISEVGGGSDTTDEITDVSQLATDFLSEDAKAKFDQAKTFCKGEYEGDEDALYEAMGADAASTVTLDSDTANKLSIKVLQKYLGILGNGAVSYETDGTEQYVTPELNMLDKELKKLFGIDVIDDGATSEDIDVLGTAVPSEDKETLYKDTMKFFEKLYGEVTDTYDGADASEDVTIDDSAADEVGEDSYDEAIAEEDYEE